MKKVISLILLVVITITMITACTNTNNDNVPDGMKRASSDDIDYIAYVPESWIIDIQTIATTAHVSTSDSSNVSFTTWSMENTDDTVETWWETTKEQFAVTGFTDYEEESNEIIELCGQDAKKIIYTLKRGEETIKYLQVAVVKNTYVYVITYTASPSSFDNNLDDVNLIIDNFKI